MVATNMVLPFGRSAVAFRMAVFRTDYIRKPFTAAGFEEAGWQKTFHHHPTERVRRKLRAVRAFALGQPIREVAQACHLPVATVQKYLTVYILKRDARFFVQFSGKPGGSTRAAPVLLWGKLRVSALESVPRKSKNPLSALLRGFSVEKMGFEPTMTFWAIHTFQACSFDHSDTSLWAKVRRGVVAGNRRANAVGQDSYPITSRGVVS